MARKRNWKNALWVVFSKYIRQRDGGVCISCGKKDDWRNLDSGHYIPKTAGLSIYFCEKNVHAQCTGCNRFRHGNLTAYALALRRKYGQQILEELDWKRRMIVKYSPADYQRLIDHYKSEIKRLGYTL